MKKVFRSNLLVALLLVFLVGCGKKSEEPKASDSSVAISSSVEKSSESTSSSSTKESSTKSSSTKESSTNSSTSESVAVSLADFVGGWGLPQSDSLFFIASDGSFTVAVIGPGESVPSYPNYSFSLTSDGKPVMNLDGASEFILEPDGTLTVDGRTYIYLGNYTLEEFRAKKAAEDQAFMAAQSQSQEKERAAAQAAQESWEAEFSKAFEEQPSSEVVYEESSIDSASYHEDYAGFSSSESQEPVQSAPAATPPTTQYVDANGQGLIKGSENGIYHVPDSTYYDRTTNPVALFTTIEEAEAAGYRAPER